MKPSRTVSLPPWWPDVRTPREDDLLRQYATHALDSAMGQRSNLGGAIATAERLAGGGPQPDPLNTVQCHETPDYHARADLPDHAIAAAAHVAHVAASLDALPRLWQRRALLAYYRVERARFSALAELMGEAAFASLWAALCPFLGLCLAGAELPSVQEIAHARDASASALMARLGMAALRGDDCGDLPLILGARREQRGSVSEILCAAQAIVVREMRARRAA